MGNSVLENTSNKSKYEGSTYNTSNCGELKIVEYVTNVKFKVVFLDTGYETFTQLVHIQKRFC